MTPGPAVGIVEATDIGGGRTAGEVPGGGAAILCEKKHKTLSRMTNKNKFIITARLAAHWNSLHS